MEKGCAGAVQKLKKMISMVVWEENTKALGSDEKSNNLWVKWVVHFLVMHSEQSTIVLPLSWATPQPFLVKWHQAGPYNLVIVQGWGVRKFLIVTWSQDFFPTLLTNAPGIPASREQPQATENLRARGGFLGVTVAQ